MILVRRPGHPLADKDGFVDKKLVYEEVGNAPNVISDIMDVTRHMATGRMHTSKSEFRKDTKASGCVEIGNDSSLYKARTPIKMDRGKRRDDIRRSLYELRNR